MSTTYPPYIEEPTGAVVPGVSGPPTPVLPGTLCNYNQGSTDPTDGWAVFTVAQVNDGPFQVLYPAGEMRREWTLANGYRECKRCSKRRAAESYEKRNQ